MQFLSDIKTNFIKMQAEPSAELAQGPHLTAVFITFHAHRLKSCVFLSKDRFGLCEQTENPADVKKTPL